MGELGRCCSVRDVFITLLLCMLACAADARAATLVCLATLGATTAVQFSPVGTLPRSAAPLDALSIVEGEPGDEGKDAPVVLIPELKTVENKRMNVWDLMPRDEPLVMVCSYRGTSAYLRAVIPKDLTSCEFTLDRHPPVGQCR